MGVGTADLVEMTGIEPVSEKLFTRLSPSAFCHLDLPFPSGGRHPHGHGSLQYISGGAGTPRETFTATRRPDPCRSPQGRTDGALGSHQFKIIVVV